MAHKMVIHAGNYKKGSVGALDKHNQRENDSYSNPDIDLERSKDNLSIKQPEVSQYQDSRKIIEERATNQVRSTSIWQTEFIISSDQEFFSTLPMNEQQRFFQEAYEYLAKEFGEENVTSAVVHFDETTPHMHFDFVPMTEDNKLSRKEVMTRERLLKIQNELPRYMREKGFDIDRGQKMNELSKKERLNHKHVNHYEYKKQLQSEISTLEGQIGGLKKKKALLVEEEKKEVLKRQIRAQEVQKKEKLLQRKEEKLQTQEKDLQIRKEKLQAGIGEHNQQIKSLQELPKGEKTLTGKISLQESDFRKLINTARKGILQEPELQESRRRNQEFSERYEDLRKKIPTVQERMELQQIRKENEILKTKSEKLEKVLYKLKEMSLPEPAQKLIENVLDSFAKVLQKEKNQDQVR